MLRCVVHSVHFALIAIAVGCAPSAPRVDAGAMIDAGPDGGRMRRDAGIDAGTDAGPCPSLAICPDGCADLTTDPAHCGRCDRACTAPADADPICVLSECDFACDPGFVRIGDECFLAPRPIWPPSLSTVRSVRPTLRWVLPSGLTDATVELCSDVACASMLTVINVTVEQAVPEIDLPAGTIFWRVSSSGRVGPTWRFDVAAHASADRAWGTTPDYDRDGYGDVAIGAPNAVDSEGRVSIFRGGSAGTSAGASAVLRGEAAGGEFGLAVACAGDLDGDGFADLAVGSPRVGAGVVTIYFGAAGGIAESGARTIVIAAPSGGTLFGATLAGVGDVDADGFGDLVVAAIGDVLTPGRIHFYRGAADGVTRIPAQSFSDSGRFGSAIAGIGDIDGDGFADVAVGAPYAFAMAGAVHVYRGDASGLTAAQTIQGAAADGQLGSSLAGVGDLNGDGFADVAAGAPNTESARGDVLVFYGSVSGLAATADVTVPGINGAGGFFGYAVAGFDGNGDGFDDLAVGAFGVDARNGRVSVFLGAAAGLSTARLNVEGISAGGDFGWALASAGDVDRNGRHDLAVGAPRADARNGRAYVFRGAAAGITDTPLVDLIGASGGSFGRAVAGSVR